MTRCTGNRTANDMIISTWHTLRNIRVYTRDIQVIATYLRKQLNQTNCYQGEINVMYYHHTHGLNNFPQLKKLAQVKCIKLNTTLLKVVKHIRRRAYLIT